MGAVGEHGDVDDLVFDSGAAAVVAAKENNTGPRQSQWSPVSHGKSRPSRRFVWTSNPTVP